MNAILEFAAFSCYYRRIVLDEFPANLNSAMKAKCPISITLGSNF